jgi:hypothetical protein
MARLRNGHLPPVAARELTPPSVGPGRLPGPRHERRARREFREPGVEKIPPTKILLRYPARWPPHGPQTDALVRCARLSQPHNPYRHQWPIICRLRAAATRRPPRPFARRATG